MNEILRRSCRGVRMVVESVSGWLWNECPDQPGITVRMLVEWVSEWARNPHSDGKSQAVRLKFAQQSVEVLSVSTDALSEAEDLLPCDYEAEPFEVGFSSRYAQETFRAVESNELEFIYSGPASGTLVKAKNLPHQNFVIMPVRL
ncbi:hypothetical protein IIE18_11045 [Pseudomonas sp. V1]|uniref:hypothetical protein n=1 Tax=Pseudomonas arcuscaelestis TaxID=2710591 RepID=UPI00193F3EE6|nr:hypothetical protein [Pseudomonas arcuscaelestis]MBM3105676.1 hypothetical protein [Pseudomonas arcuscaelestis]